MDSLKLIVDIIGWAGSVFVVLAYGGVSYGRMESSSKAYQLLNLFGSLFLIVNTVYYHAYPSATVNVIWLGIAALALIKVYRNGKGMDIRGPQTKD